jgi:hypothetical protein
MTTTTLELLPGTKVHARGLRWEVVFSQSLGPQTLFRLRGLENAVLGKELDILYPFEETQPRQHDLRPDRAAPLANWLVFHQAFLLKQTLGPDALLAVQPSRLRMEPYQLVPVLRAIRMSRVRLLLCDGVGLGKTCQAGMVTTELIARRLAHRIMIVSRDQYAHVLSTFSHASYRKAPELCPARFDELKGLSREKLTRKYDPYWDIPLNENIPQPVIDLPIPGEPKEDDDGEYRLTGAAKPVKRGRKKQ